MEKVARPQYYCKRCKKYLRSPICPIHGLEQVVTIEAKKSNTPTSSDLLKLGPPSSDTTFKNQNYSQHSVDHPIQEEPEEPILPGNLDELSSYKKQISSQPPTPEEDEEEENTDIASQLFGDDDDDTRPDFRNQGGDFIPEPKHHGSVTDAKESSYLENMIESNLHSLKSQRSYKKSQKSETPAPERLFEDPDFSQSSQYDEQFSNQLVPDFSPPDFSSAPQPIFKRPGFWIVLLIPVITFLVWMMHSSLKDETTTPRSPRRPSLSTMPSWQEPPPSQSQPRPPNQRAGREMANRNSREMANRNDREMTNRTGSKMANRSSREMANRNGREMTNRNGSKMANRDRPLRRKPPLSAVNGEMEMLIHKANQAYQKQRFTTPENDNAMNYLKRAFQYDPYYKPALDLQNKILDFYYKKAEQSFDTGDYSAAAEYFQKILYIKPKDFENLKQFYGMNEISTAEELIQNINQLALAQQEIIRLQKERYRLRDKIELENKKLDYLTSGNILDSSYLFSKNTGLNAPSKSKRAVSSAPTSVSGITGTSPTRKNIASNSNTSSQNAKMPLTSMNNSATIPNIPTIPGLPTIPGNSPVKPKMPPRSSNTTPGQSNVSTPMPKNPLGIPGNPLNLNTTRSNPNNLANTNNSSRSNRIPGNSNNLPALSNNPPAIPGIPPNPSRSSRRSPESSSNTRRAPDNVPGSNNSLRIPRIPTNPNRSLNVPQIPTNPNNPPAISRRPAIPQTNSPGKSLTRPPLRNTPSRKAASLDTTNLKIVDEKSIDGSKKYKYQEKARAPFPFNLSKKEVVIDAICIVGLDGSVEDVKLLSPNPNQKLNEAAEAALSKYIYQPATYQGKPIRFKAFEKIKF